MKELIIAIDGPSGVGKSTLSRLLAKRLGYVNLDTGAMYRAVALAAERSGTDPADGPALGRLCRETEIAFADADRICLNGDDVSAAIRTPEISMLTPMVASHPEVRDAMVKLQRQMGGAGGVVLEGRDIGTVVFPDAEVKIYLHASAEVRGRRRFLELQARGVKVDLARTVTEVEARDAADSSRAISPLRRAADAVLIDTSALNIEQVLDRMLSLVDARRRELGLPQRV